MCCTITTGTWSTSALRRGYACAPAAELMKALAIRSVTSSSSLSRMLLSLSQLARQPHKVVELIVTVTTLEAATCQYQYHSCCHHCHCDSACHASITQVHDMLMGTSARLPSFDRSRHVLPRIHEVVPRDQGFTESGMCHAVITVISRDLREAIAIRELARQTVVQVPTSIDTRGWRYASTWWVQQRGQDEARHAWQVSV